MTQPRTPKELAPKIVDMINNRIKDEYTAHFFYRNAANWCEGANYKKATEFFKQEAANELEHAEKLQKYFHINQVNLYWFLRHLFSHSLKLIYANV